MRLGPYELNTIITGDMQELSEAIPDGSIDLIFTDPPYLRECLPLYGVLAEVASRVLKPGGYVFTYGAGEYIPEILDQMRKVSDLKYFWVDILLHRDGYPRIWYKKLLSGYKPIFVFTKGEPTILRWRATVGSDSADKRYHKWGQGEGMAIKIIEMLTRPNEIIFDPFVGGGTVAVACKILQRHFLAFEIDSTVAQIAQERINCTQPPLPLIMPKQLDLI